MEWETLITNSELREKSLLALNEINEVVDNQIYKTTSVTLIDGLSGYLVFKANYNLLLNLHSSNLNFLLNKVFNELSNQTIDGSLMYGLSGVAFSYKEYASLFDNLNQEIIGDFETYINQYKCL
jgi:hypothetical protein